MVEIQAVKWYFQTLRWLVIRLDCQIVVELKSQCTLKYYKKYGNALLKLWTNNINESFGHVAHCHDSTTAWSCRSRDGIVTPSYKSPLKSLTATNYSAINTSSTSCLSDYDFKTFSSEEISRWRLSHRCVRGGFYKWKGSRRDLRVETLPIGEQLCCQACSAWTSHTQAHHLGGITKNIPVYALLQLLPQFISSPAYQ